MARTVTAVGAIGLVSQFACLPLASADVTGEPGLVGKVIVVDAGHGGPDGGAQSADGALEKNITLPIAKYTAVYLRQLGAVVYLTRDTDRDFATDRDRALGRRHIGDLKRRLRTILAHNPDAVVSIHCNAVPSPVWRGATTIYQDDNEEGKRLAYALQHVFKATLLPTKRAPENMGTLYLLKRIKGPAALAEVGFLSNPEESAFLSRPQYQLRVANSIAIALLAFYGQSTHDEVGDSNEPSPYSNRDARDHGAGHYTDPTPPNDAD